MNIDAILKTCLNYFIDMTYFLILKSLFFKHNVKEKDPLFG